MKFLVVLAVLVAAISATPDHEKWTTFKAQHAKQYKSILEEQARFRIFQSNLRRIEEQNAKYAKGDSSYYFAVTKFADWSSQEFMGMLNSQISSQPKLKATPFVPNPNLTVPDSIDWRDQGAVLAVKDQGNCGGCWAFSTTGALEGQNAIKNNKKTSLSEQQLIDCSTSYGNAGCNGGNMELAFDYVKDKGIVSETSYPFTGKDGTCKSSGSDVLKAIQGYKSVAASESSLKTAVGTVGPVSVAVEANTEWQLYGGGIFNHILCTGLSLNHGVLAVGYGNSGSDYWLIKNSWGTSWGEKGYIRLVRNQFDQCGVAKDASYPQL